MILVSMATISEALALALQYHQAGRLQEAEQLYRQILAADPQHAEAWCCLGVIAHQSGQLQAASECIGRSLSLNPNLATAHRNLAQVHLALGQFEHAAASYRRALEIEPDDAPASNELGVALTNLGRVDAAVAHYLRALELDPNFALAHNNLGIASEEQGKFLDAEKCFRRALEIDPARAQMLYNLGNVLQKQEKLGEAMECYRRALQLKPDHPRAASNLGVALWTLGNATEGAECHRRALASKPDFTEAHDALLLTLQYRYGVGLAELAQAHAEYQQRHAAPLQSCWRPHDNHRDPERRLRLGFVSPDFGRHPVGDYLIRVLENIDGQSAEIVCYNNRGSDDAQTARFRSVATNWRDVVGWNDQRLAEQIRADRIDILFDLTGHTPYNRLLTFARKPAPIQITWIGYEGTTGLTAMDYVLGDRYEIPAYAERYYCEQVLRMPDSYVCYDPPKDAPDISSLPALQRKHITFGCFNNPAKINDTVIEVWARILRRVPDARLMLKFKGMTSMDSIRRFEEGFGAYGIDAARLDFRGHSPYGEHLADYQNIDLALDPFPFNGGVTTCEALWMGVPVVTCPGETFASRHTLSHLSNVGLIETIARDLDDYVEVAVNLAGDLPRLADIRSRLRGQMAASPLCDGPRFAENFLALLRDVWRKWVGGN
jgi:protein O-GlcNAc transferase